MRYKLEKPVLGTIARKKYKCVIEWRNGTFITDEPESVGGEDAGPDPFTLLLASIASCKLITLRMYIDKKGWNIDKFAINVNLYQETIGETKNAVIDCDIIFLCHVSVEQKMRMLEIAHSCPISKVLEGDVKVRVFSSENPTTLNR
ncbi:MAG: peroxiredoxin [Bacteroidetes bacterium]|nr:MAG: peroxiredoxin [Bacteroidota bacterium]